MKSAQIKQITSKAIEELVAALNAGRSEALTNYLAAMGRFHRYSFFNVMLIVRACPNATHVAGYQTWKSLGRYVKKGEKGIMILAPLFRRRTDESNEADNANLDSSDSCKLTGFRAVYVFDESMTGGNPLPQIGSVNGDPGKHRERLERFVREQSIELEYSDDIAPAKGVSEGGKIKLLPGQSPAETVATLVHELAHERLHRAERRSSTTKRIRETEAEAVALWFAKPSALNRARRARTTSPCGMVTPLCCLRASNSCSAPPPKSSRPSPRISLCLPKAEANSRFDAIWVQCGEAVEAAKVRHVQCEDMAHSVDVHGRC